MNRLNELKLKIENNSIETLKEICKKLNNDFQDGACLVFEEVLSALESKMNEIDFINFCESL